MEDHGEEEKLKADPRGAERGLTKSWPPKGDVEGSKIVV